MKVTAALSIPRLCFSDHIWTAIEAFSANGIALDRAHGPFWHHGLTQLLEEMVSAGNDWIFTTDYDTLFSAETVRKMLEIVNARDDIDALSAMQIRRDMDRVMGWPIEPAKDGLRKMRQTHFGLTLLRTSALAELPKPWFHEIPDDDGGWGPKSIHADVYFWRGWEMAGNSLYLTTNISIGHLELMDVRPKKGGGVVYQHVADWHETKKPPDGAIGT